MTPKPRLVLVHGSMDRGRAFRRVEVALADRFATETYDRRGYGDSALEPAGLSAHVDDLLARIGDAPTPVAVVGHSYGGAIALGASLRRPDLLRTVGVYEPALPWLEWWPPDTAGGRALAAAAEHGTEVAAEVFMRTILGDAVWEGLSEADREQRRDEGKAMIAELADIRAAPPFDPSTVAVPVHIGSGSESPPHLRKGARWLAETIPGATFTELAGAGHSAHVTHAADFAAWITTYC